MEIGDCFMKPKDGENNWLSGTMWKCIFYL